MTMHLLPAYVTTTKFKHNKKKKSASAIKADIEHDKFLKKMGVHPDQLKAKKSSNKAKYSIRPNTHVAGKPQTTVSQNWKRDTDQIPVGVAVKKDANIYSGERKLLGISAMHKSSLVPVFSSDQAKEIANMRRG